MPAAGPVLAAAYDPVGMAVLVVSTDAAMRRGLSLLLQVEGFAVHVFDDLAAALAGSDPGVGCIVIDDDRRSPVQDPAARAALVTRHRDAEFILLAEGQGSGGPLPGHGGAGRVLVVLQKPVLDDSVVRWVDRALARAALRTHTTGFGQVD